MKTVEPYKTTLSSGNAYWMARIAGAVYMKKSTNDPFPDEKKILADLKKEDPNFINVYGYSKNTAQAALVEHKDYFCFAFRGTDEIKDWLDNVNVFAEKALFGEFHRGFWRSLNDVWQPLYKKYNELWESDMLQNKLQGGNLQIKKVRPIFITGHSLGGAMATIAVARLIHEDKPFISAYTFGQPRAMSVDTARIFNVEAKSRVFRFQNNNDIVTRIPARLMGYSHAGSFLYISDEQQLHNDPGFWYQFLDAIDGTVESFRDKKLDAIEDHGMAHYLDAIKKWDCTF
ncbi:MAG: lipase family protein [Methyloglobulus sp.]